MGILVENQSYNRLKIRFLFYQELVENQTCANKCMWKSSWRWRHQIVQRLFWDSLNQRYISAQLFVNPKLFIHKPELPVSQGCQMSCIYIGSPCTVKIKCTAPHWVHKPQFVPHFYSKAQNMFSQAWNDTKYDLRISWDSREGWGDETLCHSTLTLFQLQRFRCTFLIKCRRTRPAQAHRWKGKEDVHMQIWVAHSWPCDWGQGGFFCHIWAEDADGRFFLHGFLSSI